MAETSQIARMAQKISDEIFAQFYWTKIGPIDQNWSCQNKEKHGKETHPSDVVFWYPEPYKDTITYIQCDLKSYAADSIRSSSVRVAMESLSQQVACAEISEEWQKLYVNPTNTFEVASLLFIYNHDGGYDRSFDDTLKKVKTESLDLPIARKMIVLGPAEINWLSNVASDLLRLRGQSRLPPKSACSFFYPQAIRRPKLREGESCAATLEMLTGPWVILSYRDEERSRSGVFIFYRSEGDTIEEFLYLIDFLRQHDLLSSKLRVNIRTLDGSGNSLINFQKAKQTYLLCFDEQAQQSGLAEIIDEIEVSVINERVTRFSDVQIGMEYA